MAKLRSECLLDTPNDKGALCTVILMAVIAVVTLFLLHYKFLAFLKEGIRNFTLFTPSKSILRGCLHLERQACTCDILYEANGNQRRFLNVLKVPVVIIMPPIRRVYVIISLNGSAHYGMNF